MEFDRESMTLDEFRNIIDTMITQGIDPESEPNILCNDRYGKTSSMRIDLFKVDADDLGNIIPHINPITIEHKRSTGMTLQSLKDAIDEVVKSGISSEINVFISANNQLNRLVNMKVATLCVTEGKNGEALPYITPVWSDWVK